MNLTNNVSTTFYCVHGLTPSKSPNHPCIQTSLASGPFITSTMPPLLGISLTTPTLRLERGRQAGRLSSINGGAGRRLI